MRYLATRTPLGLFGEMDRFFDRFHEVHPTRIGFDVDVAETKDSYVITGNLPGFAADDLDVKVEGNLLTIKAKVLEDVEKKNDDATWHYRERREGNMERSFVLPEKVDKNRVEAFIKNGVLLVTLNKTVESSPKSITVRSE